MDSKNSDYFLKQICHHKNIVDEGSNNIFETPDPSKVSWRHFSSNDVELLPVEKFSMDQDMSTLGGDSDVETSADMDLETLQNAEVWTDTETVKMHIAHLSKLKNAYINEFDQLNNLLKDSRKKYLKEVAEEKEALPSIHAQSKLSLKERDDYNRLKALQRYSKHNGRQAILRQKYLLKKESALLVSNNHESMNIKEKCSIKSPKNCSYNQGSWKCSETAIPLAPYCVKHILEDSDQVLYRECGGGTAGDKCSTAVIPLPHVSSCVFHAPLFTASEEGQESPTDNDNDTVEIIPPREIES